MADVLIVLALCCCLSSSASSAGYAGGLIPNTAPHFLKFMEASDLKEDLSPGPTPANCQEVDEDALLDKIAEYESEKVFSLFDFKSLEKEEVLNTYLETTDILGFADACANPGPSPGPSPAQ